MPERKAVDYHDIQLDSGEDTPTTSVKLMLAENEQGGPLWREGRLKPLPMRISQGEIRYAHFDPLRDLVFSQKSWHRGALQQIEDPTKPHRYLQANGLDMRHEGVATLGMARSQQISIILPNPGWESGNAGGWTLTGGSGGGTATVVTTAPRTGSYHLRLFQAGGYTASTAEYRIPNFADFAGRTIRFLLYGRSYSAAYANTVQIQIGDGVGGNSVANLNPITTYTYLSATRTIDANPNMLQLVITTTGGGASGEIWYADDMLLLVSSNDTCVGTAEARGKLYAAVGPLILRWNETNDFWESVYTQPDGALATDIISFNDRIYVAYGYS